MNTFIRFFYEFISIFFDGIVMIFSGLYDGLKKMFNIGEYARLISSYNGNFNAFEKVLVTISVMVLIIIAILIILLLIFIIRKLLRKMDTNLDKDELLDEIADLNNQVAKLMKEKDEIMALKVSQLGINPEDEENAENATEGKPEGDEENTEEDGDPTVRFPKLAAIDNELGETKPKNYDNNFTLAELIDNFRCFSASQLKLYYDYDILRPFFGGLACGKLIILQGISGTGKTSLAYAWGKFVEQDSCVSSVEPSWKDKSDFLGYFNEFTKKFNETRALGEIYAS